MIPTGSTKPLFLWPIGMDGWMDGRTGFVFVLCVFYRLSSSSSLGSRGIQRNTIWWVLYILLLCPSVCFVCLLQIRSYLKGFFFFFLSYCFFPSRGAGVGQVGANDRLSTSLSLSLSQVSFLSTQRKIVSFYIKNGQPSS